MGVLWKSLDWKKFHPFIITRSCFLEAVCFHYYFFLYIYRLLSYLNLTFSKNINSQICGKMFLQSNLGRFPLNSLVKVLPDDRLVESRGLLELVLLQRKRIDFPQNYSRKRVNIIASPAWIARAPRSTSRCRSRCKTQRICETASRPVLWELEQTALN